MASKKILSWKHIAIPFFIFFDVVLLAAFVRSIGNNFPNRLRTQRSIVDNEVEVERPVAQGMEEGSTTSRFVQVIRDAEISSEPTYGGVAWGDYNNDGYLDLLLPMGNNSKYLLYRNNGDETFTDVTEKSRISEIQGVHSALFGDYDNDGCEDIFFSAFGNVKELQGSPDRLYHNNCDDTFTDVTTQAGLDDSYHSSSAAWADYDRDGFLDLYVATWGQILWGRTVTEAKWTIEPSLLYHNNGDGTFRKVPNSVASNGLAKCPTLRQFPQYGQTYPYTSPYTPLPWKLAWQPIWFDYNNDGFPDLFVTHDDGVSVLYRNNSGRSFTDTTDQAGLCVIGSGMGVSAGDYDTDGDLDLYVTNTDRNLFWKNNGNGKFTEISENAGVANYPFLGWGTEFIDFDNDGYLDIYAVNGTTYGSNPYAAAVSERINKRQDQLYRGNGHGTFTEVSDREGLFGNDSKSAAAFGDYNNDGFMDVFVVADSFPDQVDMASNRLYRNTPDRNHWLTVRLIGTKSNRDGVGARIYLTAGGRTQMREITAGSSFLSQSSLWQTFGIGVAISADEIKVVWPSGIVQKYTDVTADRKFFITEGRTDL